MISSTASAPVATPPTPTIGRFGRAACTSNTARTATGWMARPDRPPPPPPSAGRRCSRSITMPITVLTSVTADAPASCAAAATATSWSVLGLSLAHTGRPQTRDAAIASAVAVGECAKRCDPPSRFGQLRFTSTATTDGGAAGEHRCGTGIVVDRSPPGAHDDPRAGPLETGQIIREPRFDTGTLQPDAVDHAGRHRMEPRRRVSAPRVRQRATSRRPRRARAARDSDAARRRDPTCPTPS